MESKEVTNYQDAIKCLQAVIIADSFSQKFRPVSHELLKCLFPIANVQILSFVIEFLILNNVTEIYVATNFHKNKIDRLIKESNFKKQGVKVSVIQLEDSKCIGDVLREISQTQLLKQDFILMRGDTITNVDI